MWLFCRMLLYTNMKMKRAINNVIGKIKDYKQRKILKKEFIDFETYLYQQNMGLTNFEWYRLFLEVASNKIIAWKEDNREIPSEIYSKMALYSKRIEEELKRELIRNRSLKQILN